MRWPVWVLLGLGGCTMDRAGFGRDGSGGAENATAAETSSSAAVGGSESSSAGGGGTEGTGGGGSGGCYGEPYDTSVSLSDLESAYQRTAWLPTMLEILDRRYDNGWFVLDQMKDDPWLLGTFPQFFELGSWAGMIEAIDTACHEETHGYDFEQALGTPGKHVFYMGANLEIVAAKLAFFPRNAIVPFVTQGGSVTSGYDATYLTGTQGNYDFVFLADELTAYINGLACATSVGDHITGGHSYRDGAAAHLYYLLGYLKVARTEHASLYATWQADADWQSFVRLSWARGHFWTEASMVYPALGIDDAAIWQRIDDPANRQEIELFTGDDPDDVACSP